MCYGFPVKEIDYENKENEVVTILTHLVNEQLARQGAGAGPLNGLTIKKTQLNC